MKRFSFASKIWKYLNEINFMKGCTALAAICTAGLVYGLVVDGPKWKAEMEARPVRAMELVGGDAKTGMDYGQVKKLYGLRGIEDVRFGIDTRGVVYANPIIDKEGLNELVGKIGENEVDSVRE